MSKVILKAHNLTKQFDSFTAVRDVSFSVKEGEVVGLLGPNGAGKTTTISMLLGIITPTAGYIRIFDKDLETHKTEILQHMNYSSAYSKLPWRLKVWESLYVFSMLYNVKNPKKRIDELLKAFDVAHHKNTLMGDLSAGNATRINLCKAFINKPRLVLLDEPTASLDPDIADRVRKYIKESRDRFATTILITSHNMAEIEELCDRVIFINHGRIIAQNTPEELSKKIQNTRLRLMMRDGQKRTVAYCKRHHLPCTTSDREVVIELPEHRVAHILNDLAHVGVEYSQISIDKPTLEDYFLGEVRHET